MSNSKPEKTPQNWIMDKAAPFVLERAIALYILFSNSLPPINIKSNILFFIIGLKKENIATIDWSDMAAKKEIKKSFIPIKYLFIKNGVMIE